MQRLREVELEQLKKEVPEFEIGDTVEVHVRLVEEQPASAPSRGRGRGRGAPTRGEATTRERIQVFSGTVIARKGSGLRETFTVRRIVQGEGVERVFPIHSPFVTDVKVVRQGRVRRAKLYYLRDRVGKATRVKQRRWTPRKK
jgi:large subunit ribosomal protein L19